MTQRDVDALRDFIQRELDLLRQVLEDSRREQAEDHREVKLRLGSLESGQVAILSRVGTLETHEQADQARAEGELAERQRRARRARQIAGLVVGGSTVAGIAVGIAFAVIDHLT